MLCRLLNKICGRATGNPGRRSGKRALKPPVMYGREGDKFRPEYGENHRPRREANTKGIR